MGWVTEAQMEGLKADAAAAEAALAKAEAAVEKERAHIAKVHADMLANDEVPFTSGGEIGPLEKALERAREARNAAVAALKDATVIWPDGELPLPTETGHYDDGHAFGWNTKKKAAVLVIGLGSVAAAVAGAFAVFGSGNKTTSVPTAAATSTAPTSTAAPQPSTTMPTTGALPTNTAVAGCIAIDPQGSVTVLHQAFLLTNPLPGKYTATFASGPTGAVSGSGEAKLGTNLVETAVTITAFGTYDGLTITSPDGTPIAIGPIATQLPLVINEQTDKPNGCDGSALTMPAAPPARDSVARDHAAIEAFLPRFSEASRDRDLAQLVAMLDPAVLTRYSEAQCTADLDVVESDPTAAFVFKGFTSGPEPFTYTSDGRSTIVPNTYVVAVTQTSGDTTTETSIHLSVDPTGNVGWFTDCTH